MKRTKEQKGITLIALIITIIVLLILAVVAIRAVQGDGIIQHAKNASAEHKAAQEKEEIALALNGWTIQKNIPGNTETFASYIGQKLTGCTVEEDDEGLSVTMESGTVYTVTEAGEVSEKVILESRTISKWQPCKNMGRVKR